MGVGDRPLREVLTLDLDPVQVEATADYALAGVHSLGRGLFQEERSSRGPAQATRSCIVSEEAIWW